MLTEEKIDNDYKLNIQYFDSCFYFGVFYIFQKKTLLLFGVRKKLFLYKMKSYSVVQKLKTNDLHVSQLINPSFLLFFSSLIAPLSFYFVVCWFIGSLVGFIGPICPALDAYMTCLLGCQADPSSLPS